MYENKKIETLITSMKEYLNKPKTKEESIRFLQEAGILDENGHLAEPYRQ